MYLKLRISFFRGPTRKLVALNGAHSRGEWGSSGVKSDRAEPPAEAVRYGSGLSG